HVGAVGMRRVNVHHGRVGPAVSAFNGDNAGDGRAGGLEQVDLEGPGPGDDYAFVGEVVHLDEGVVPVAANERALLAQQVQRGVVLIAVEGVGIGDAKLGVVVHQVQGRVGDVDGAVICLDATGIAVT